MRSAAVAAAAALLAPACGPSTGVAPGTPFSIEQETAPAAFAGSGDQTAPSLRGDLIAFVDYGGDGNGGCYTGPEDVDCAGVLVIHRLGEPAPVLQLPVARALPALGDGFVAWTESAGDQAQASTEPRGSVRALRFDWDAPRVLTAPGELADASRPPAVDRDHVAWLTPGGEHQGVRVHHLDSAETRTLTVNSPWQLAGVALDSGRVAFVDYDREARSWQVQLEDLLTGVRRAVAPLPTGYTDLWTPALRGDLVAFKQGPRWGCWSGDCAIRVVVERLDTGARAVLGGESVSRYGPVMIDGGAVLWLDTREGPYALYGERPGDAGADPVRLTPEGAVLGWIAPASADGGRLAWADRSGGDFDVRLTRLW